jgi:hypothetical protein
MSAKQLFILAEDGSRLRSGDEKQALGAQQQQQYIGTEGWWAGVSCLQFPALLGWAAGSHWAVLRAVISVPAREGVQPQTQSSTGGAKRLMAAGCTCHMGQEVQPGRSRPVEHK